MPVGGGETEFAGRKWRGSDVQWLFDVFRIKPTATGGDLVWQYIDKDLTIRDTGKWSITLDQTKDVPTLKYVP